MVRVLIAGFCVLPGYTRAGVQVVHILRALARHNSVDVLVVRADDQPYIERMSNARILRVPIHAESPRQQVNAFRRAVWRQLEGADYDIVHFRDGWSGIPILELRERLHFKAVFDAARAPLAEPQLSADMAAELARDEEACLLAADMVLTPTEIAQRYVAARGRPERVFVVPPGVDVNQFDYDHPAAGPPHVLYMGALAPGHGLRILMRAVFDLASRTSAHLTLVGPAIGGFDLRLQAVVDDLELSDRVDLVGPVDHEDVPAVIARATACVVPTAADLTPRPTALYPTRLLEYMACMRAVVAPRTSTVAMLIKDGINGLLFTPGDHADLTLKLMRLLGNGPLREKLAQTAYHQVRRQHTASQTRRCLRGAYEALGNMADEERFRVSWGGFPTSVAATPASVYPNVTTELEDRDLITATSTDGHDYEQTEVVADDVTTVDVAKDVKWVDRARTVPRLRVEEWVVAETNADRIVTQLDAEDEGTPVDVKPVSAGTSPLENRFVAGELDVPTPAPEMTDEVFSAVSVLLGSDGGETPTPTPTTSRRRRARREDSSDS